MRSFTSRVEQLERVVAPARQPINILRVIVDPKAPGDRVTEVIARGDGIYTKFPRLDGEPSDQLRERAKRTMGWT